MSLGGERAYIRVVAELLNDVRVEMTGVALESITDGESVLHAIENLADEVLAAALAQLEVLLLLGTLVNGLDPAVMVARGGVINVILELDDVRVGDMVGINGAQKRCGTTVNSLGAERSSLGGRGQAKGGDALHTCG